MKTKTRYRIQVLIGILIANFILYYWLTPYIRALAHHFVTGH